MQALGEGGWHELDSEDGPVRSISAQVVYVRAENDDQRVGFGWPAAVSALALVLGRLDEAAAAGAHAGAQPARRPRGGAVLATRGACRHMARDRRGRAGARSAPEGTLAAHDEDDRAHRRAEHCHQARRPPPPPELAGLPPLTSTPTQLSFPSAHASTSFAGGRCFAAWDCRRCRSTGSPPRCRCRGCTWACTTPRTWSPVRCWAALLAARARAPRRRGGSAVRAMSTTHRHRGDAQRGQVLAVQRAHQSGRGGGQLPVHDDRAERRGRARARRAHGGGGEHRGRVGDRVGHGRLPRHRGPRRGRA